MTGTKHDLAGIHEDSPNEVLQYKRSGDRRSMSRSATRALDVLEHFGEVGRPLRAIEVANALALHPSTADQLLKTMVGSAHLVFNAHSKRYFPSPRLARFGRWVGGYFDGAFLHDLLLKLHAATGELITLTTPHDTFMQVIDTVEDAGSNVLAERGMRITLFGSAVGGAYLSTLSKFELQALMERANRRQDEMQKILKAIEEFRRDGYAFRGQSDVWSMGVPLKRGASGIQFVIGLTGPPQRMADNRTEYYRQILDCIAQSRAQTDKVSA